MRRIRVPASHAVESRCGDDAMCCSVVYAVPATFRGVCCQPVLIHPHHQGRVLARIRAAYRSDAFHQTRFYIKHPLCSPCLCGDLLHHSGTESPESCMRQMAEIPFSVSAPGRRRHDGAIPSDAFHQTRFYIQHPLCSPCLCGDSLHHSGIASAEGCMG